MAATAINFDIDYYHLLEIEPSADCEIVKKAYRKKALEFHPDKSAIDHSEDFAQITVAKELLCNVCQKARYDAQYTKISKHHEQKSNQDSQEAKPASSIPTTIELVYTRKYQPVNDNLFEQTPLQPELHKTIHDNSHLINTILLGQLILAKVLVKSCSNDLDSENSYGYSPLHYASLFGYTDLAILLLKYGAIIKQDRFGETPLHLALKGGHVATALALLHGNFQDKFNIADEHGTTPLVLAQDICSQESIAKRSISAHQLRDETTGCVELLGLLE